MAYYKCTFLNDKGNLREAVLFAESKETLKNNHSGAEEKLVSVKRIYFRNITLSRIFSRRISNTEFIVFNQKLITLLESGISFVKALEIILKNTKDGNFKEVLLKARADIKNGVKISDAFSSSHIPFLKIYQASLLAGEKSGSLENILKRFLVYIEKITNLKKKTISSLTYPVVLFVFMVGMVLLILLYAIPEFSSFYESFDTVLPLSTTYVIGVSDFLLRNIGSIFFAIAGLYITIRLIEKYRKKIIIRDYLKTKIPFIGRVITENSVTVFSRTLAILISGGIPVPEAMEIAVETFSNRYFLSKIKDTPVKIKEGNLLSDVLDKVDFIPGIMVEIIKVGESSGNLTEILNKNADYFENAIDTRVNTMISLIEPVLIIFLGLIIAFMLISVYLPIFNSVKVIR